MLREFKKLMCARFFFTLASTMQAVVMGWQMYKLTHNPLDLGLIGLTAAVPALSIAMYAGYIVDRSRPLVVYKWVLRGSFLSAAVLFLSQLSILHGSISQQVFGLFLSSFITGGAMCLVTVATVAWRAPVLRQLDLKALAAKRF